MPCSDGTNRQYEENLKAEVDKLTGFLCELCTQLEEAGQRIGPNLRVWWAAHKEADRRRLAEEQRERDRQLLRAQARGKLTRAEREALGIRG